MKASSLMQKIKGQIDAAKTSLREYAGITIKQLEEEKQQARERRDYREERLEEGSLMFAYLMAIPYCIAELFRRNQSSTAKSD